MWKKILLDWLLKLIDDFLNNRLPAEVNAPGVDQSKNAKLADKLKVARVALVEARDCCE